MHRDTELNFGEQLNNIFSKANKTNSYQLRTILPHHALFTIYERSNSIIRFDIDCGEKSLRPNLSPNFF